MTEVCNNLQNVYELLGLKIFLFEILVLNEMK